MLRERLAATPPKPGRAGTVVGRVLMVGVLGFLWVFPTFSAVFLIEREPIRITVTSCDGYGRDDTGECDGEWTLADGSAGAGVFTEYREEHEPGDVLDGVYIGGRAALSPLPWVLDVVLMYPLAIGLTIRLVLGFVRDRRRRRAVALVALRAYGGDRAAGPAADGRREPGAGARALLYVVLGGAYVFLWGFPTYSAYAVATADPVAITVTDCTPARCHGEWTAPDGEPDDGSIEVWEEGLGDGDVIDGLAIGERTVVVPFTWILDMVLLYPLAVVFTVGHLLLWRRARRKAAAGGGEA